MCDCLRHRYIATSDVILFNIIKNTLMKLMNTVMKRVPNCHTQQFLRQYTGNARNFSGYRQIMFYLVDIHQIIQNCVLASSDIISCKKFSISLPWEKLFTNSGKSILPGDI